MKPFVDLGKKDEFSLKHALGNTKTVLPLLKERGQKYYAVSNYCEISNWIQQMSVCGKAGIIPILGMEVFVNNFRYASEQGIVTVHDLYRDEKKALPEMDETGRDMVTLDYPVDLFARTVQGYYNIIQIHNDAQLNGIDRRPRTHDRFLESHGEGIVAVMPAPYSETASLIYNRMFDEAWEKFRYYQGIFDAVYLALPIVDDPEYREIDADIVRFAARYGVAAVPVCNSHYHFPDDEEAFHTLRKLSRLRGGMSYEVDEVPGMYYRSREEVDELFRRRLQSPVFTEAVYQSAQASLDALLSRFGTLEIDTSLRLPRFENGAERLRERAWKGFLAHGYDRKGREYRERFDYEIENIIGAGFADYFLILEEVFSWYRNDMRSLGAFGRGSAAGSLILNCIGCTNVDPIKYNLLFERFLDAERFAGIVRAGGQVSGCFPAETVVRLKDGYETIANVRKGDMVVSYDGGAEPVLNTVETGIRDFFGLTYRSPADGSRYRLEATLNHVFPILRGGAMIEIPLGAVRGGVDRLVWNEKEGAFADVEEISFSRRARGYDLTVAGQRHYRVCGRRMPAHEPFSDGPNA